ncbi:hypothetical protein BD560DRAFT_439312 [Blakeslea trispora]|nr:hypothetical protein BD560DRAFT_439312 [Blakeslea trispora]
MTDSRDYLSGNIRPNIFWNAACFLKEAPLYKKMNITLDETCDTDDDDDLFDDVPIGGEETMFGGASYLRMAPGEGQQALSVIRDTYVDFLAFPKIFCGHALEPMVDGKPVGYAAFTKSIIRRADRRDVIRDYLFFMDRKKLLISLVRSTSIMVRKSFNNRLTASEAQNERAVTVTRKTVQKDFFFTLNLMIGYSNTF